MPFSQKPPANPKKVRKHLDELEVRMAKEGFVNPSRVAEIMTLGKPTVYRWMQQGHVAKMECRQRVFMDLKTLRTFLRDPLMSDRIEKFAADLIAEHEAEGSDEPSME
jgi:glutathionyl-hydroquinone reductase